MDTIYPSVTGTEIVDPLDATKRKVTLTATDNTGGSGLWGEGIKYRIVDKNITNLSTVFTDSKCNISTDPFYAPFPETGAGFSYPPYTLPVSYDPLTQKVVYCVQDNAHNQLVGTYPFYPNALIGCFSDGSQQFVPNLDISGDHYYSNGTNGLLARIGAGTYGYELTDSTESVPMTNFRTQLTQNMETYVKRQYCPTTENFQNLLVDIGEKITSAVPELQYAARIKSVS